MDTALTSALPPRYPAQASCWITHADDHAMVAAALPVYDALYAWCRDAQGETHSWKEHAA